ncbi:hypothetical protein [Pseudomonas putida]|uniref:hypothetical protein n=1 Tax=Pseudomonas putida TaxID=303 RepID=UPI0034673ECC
MDTNKMREQFEAAWRTRYPEHGDIALKRSGLDPEDYCNTRVKDSWWAWQASREAVAVVLPDEEPGYMYYAPDVLEAIEAQGLKVEVKP